jgi:hypothetical protein
MKVFHLHEGSTTDLHEGVPLARGVLRAHGGVELHGGGLLLLQQLQELRAHGGRHLVGRALHRGAHDLLALQLVRAHVGEVRGQVLQLQLDVVEVVGVAVWSGGRRGGGEGQ